MNRTLLIMRHAKSSWTTDATTDHARPLNGRGRKDAPKMGQHLAARGLVPEWVLSSDSQRTRETWTGFASALSTQPIVQFESSLYHGGYFALRDLLLGLPDHVRSVMAIGHNPGWSDLASTLCGTFVSLTTGNVAVLTLESSDWATAGYAEGQWELEALYRPKTLHKDD
jgi:phosphohistidine phosphatase